MSIRKHTVHKKALAQKLYQLYELLEQPDFDVQEYSEALLQQFTVFGSQMLNENLDRVEFGFEDAIFDTNSIRYGLQFKGKSFSNLASILDVLSRMPVPEHIEFQDRYPDMTTEEWQIAMRICNLVLGAFSPYQTHQDKDASDTQ